MRNWMKWTVIIAMFAACDADPVIEPPDGPDPHADAWTHADPTPKGPALLHPTDDVTGKEARRMTVDQLRRSIPILFDGIEWTLQRQNGPVNGFDALSRTLGEADYIETFENIEEPSPLFAKFMDDMAGDVCRKAIQRDLAGGADKVVMISEDVDQNLRILALKFLGLHVPDGSMEGIEDLRGLYDAIAAEADPAAAWGGVCVAIVTAPEFLAY